ncbi:electron transport complex subunit RsxG [Uliginosibacterium sediminicola]|uniref:Ion-translocating oxidoreductase complex subunit G n=1 Tax=Uliginosibacterium sediminicola TaxID=2024550 RepID=A0ABU9Z0K7_9RHOO
MSKPLTPFKLSAQTAAMMMAFTLVFTALMAGTYQATRTTIAESAEAEKLILINQVLPPASYDNKLLQDTYKLGATPELGLDEGGFVYRARKDGKPVAVVMEAVAPDGYSGKIRLVIAVKTDGTVSGVRVTEHRETPGLGDYIDPKKDKNKQHPWIAQFEGKSLSVLPFERWKVNKDGGDFVYMSGATISPSAVIKAVAHAVKFAADNQAKLFE